MAIDVILRRLWAMAERGAAVTADDMRAAIDLPAGGGGRGSEAASWGTPSSSRVGRTKDATYLTVIGVDQHWGQGTQEACVQMRRRATAGVGAQACLATARWPQRPGQGSSSSSGSAVGCAEEQQQQQQTGHFKSLTTDGEGRVGRWPRRADVMAPPGSTSLQPS